MNFRGLPFTQLEIPLLKNLGSTPDNYDRVGVVHMLYSKSIIYVICFIYHFSLVVSTLVCHLLSKLIYIKCMTFCMPAVVL